MTHFTNLKMDWCTRRLKFIFIMLLTLPMLALAQTKKITGTVKDASGQGIPGVTILIEGGGAKTQTDSDGKFAISAKPGDVLVTKYISYADARTTVDERSNYNLTIKEEANDLNDVVVIGYGTTKKENLTGAVSTISSKRLESRPITNLATGLQGVSPGLNITRTGGQPGAEDISVQIRGATSANGAASPLVVIDGISTSIDALSRLNPNDVESISVLKDAATAAIYGAQSSGGVIVVTTKSGKTGKTELNASVLYSLKKPINLATRMSLIDEANFVNLAYMNSDGPLQYTQTQLGYIRDNIPYAHNLSNPLNIDYFNQIPPADLLLNNYSPSQTYDVSISGGTEKINYFVSGGMLNEQGMFKIGKDEARRYNGRLKLGSKLTKNISLDANLAYTNLFNNASQTSTGTGNPLNGSNGLIYEITRFRLKNPLYTPNGNYAQGTIASLTEGGGKTFSESRFDANATLAVKDLVKGLILKAIVGGQYRIDDDTNFRRSVQLYGSNYATAEGNKVVDTPGSIINSSNSYSEEQQTRKRLNLQYLADYSTILAGKHAISALAGYEFQDYKLTQFAAKAENLFNNDIPALTHSDKANQSNSQDYDAYAFGSVFGRLNYTYDRRYVIEGTFRRDQSSKLAPDNQTQNFGAISGAWNVHNESWFKDAIQVINQLKIRASWGRLGGALGDNFGNFTWANTLDRKPGLVLGDIDNPYYYQKAIPSSVITWENIETTNYGIDLAVFKNKLRFTGEYYTMNNRNMATKVPVPAVLGVDPPKKNIGHLKGHGWETEITYSDKIGKDWNFSVGFNLADNQNKLVKFENNTSITTGYVKQLLGYPLNTYWGYRTDGYYNTQQEVDNAPKLTGSNKTIGLGDVKYVDINGDGQINRGNGTLENHGDLVYLGSNNPRYSYGFTLNVEFKNFDFSLFLQGVGKRSFAAGDEYIAPLARSWMMPLAIHGDYWRPDNQNALFPRPYYQATHNYQPSDKFIFSAAYMRVKNIQLGYTLPQRITKKFGCKNLRVFFTGQDLLTFTNMKGLEDVYDPESRENTVSDYPFFGTASFGLNMNF